MIPLMNSGIEIGIMFSMGLSPFIALWFGWKMVFYSYATCTFIWVLLFFLGASDSPEFDNWITAEEKALILTRSLLN
jgi:predicted MFS family arabinose efflux permease